MFIYAQNKVINCFTAYHKWYLIQMFSKVCNVDLWPDQILCFVTFDLGQYCSSKPNKPRHVISSNVAF